MGQANFFQRALCAAVVFSLAILGRGSALGDEGDEQEADRPALTIGSEAPELDVEHWIQDGEGKFKPVSKFAPGQVYIVEFWATWCRPCIASMPHIVELQKEYADKDVQVVSISDESLETIEKFLERDVREGEGTYAELTKSYCLTTDPDRSVHEDYLEAAAQKGIPTAFIVGKSGHVEWIGHPMLMDKPLAAITDDKWDREVFAKQFKAEQAADQMVAQLGAMLRAGQGEEALELVDKAIADSETDTERKNYLSLKFRVVTSGRLTDAIPGVVAELLKLADTPEAVNQITWSVYQAAAAGVVDDEKLLKSCSTASTAAAKKSEGRDKGIILDTAAHLQYQLGNLDRAIRIQSRAVKLVDGDIKAQMTEFLDDLKAEKNDEGKKVGKETDEKKQDAGEDSKAQDAKDK